jgi:hypothetical protein
MRPVLLPPLPFQPIALSDESLRAVDATLAELEERFQLAKSAMRKVLRVYLKWCSPRQAPPVGLRLTAVYLAWFFAINDLTSLPSKQTLLTDVRAVLRGAPAKPGSSLLDATEALQREIDVAFGHAQLARYQGRLEQMFDAFAWEVSQAGLTPSSADYFRERVHFVAVYPYLELWRLALGLEPAALDERLVRLEQLSVELTLLVNDLLSVERDTAERKHNLVFCLAAERGCDSEQASRVSLELLDSRIGEFQRLSAETSAESDAKVRTYIEFLGSVAEGTRVAMLDLRERYSPASSA